jgi:hypothetical protein
LAFFGTTRNVTPAILLNEPGYVRVLLQLEGVLQSHQQVSIDLPLWQRAGYSMG